jgi:CPA1 family monovalent cation:H+ antiporter
MDITTQVSEFIALLLISTIVGVGVKYIKLPYTIALVIVGLIVGISRIFPEIRLTEDMIFFLILPPLLFEGAINMDLNNLRVNLKPISLLAIIGVLISVLVTGYMISTLLKLPLAIALVFGAMITPTDPVSVLATFKKLGAPKKLSTILEGESILNDGTGIVVFSILLEMVRSGALDIAGGIMTFIFVCAGGLLVGASIGYVAYKVLSYIDDHQIEITITLIIAFSTFIIAEYLHVSGVIAVVAAGLVIGNYGTYFSMSPSTRVALVTFWGFFVFIVNSIVFLLIGIDIHFDKIVEYHEAILLAILVVLIARAIAVYGLLSLHTLFSGKADRIPLLWRHITFWGGLHGTIPVALALSLSDIPYRDLIASMTFGVVLFSLVIQGLSLEFLVKRFFGKRDEKRLKYEELIGRRIALKAALAEVEKMRAEGEIPPDVAERMYHDLKTILEELSSELSGMMSEEIEKEVWLTAWRKILYAQKSAIRDAAVRGLIGEDIAGKLMEEIDIELEKEEEV